MSSGRVRIICPRKESTSQWLSKQVEPISDRELGLLMDSYRIHQENKRRRTQMEEMK